MIARKVGCDRTLPSCNRCLKANRVCQGYGVRLFWPNEGDKRRAVVQRLPRKVNTKDPGTFEFIHTSTWDVMVYDILADGDRSSKFCAGAVDREPYIDYQAPR